MIAASPVTLANPDVQVSINSRPCLALLEILLDGENISFDASLVVYLAFLLL
jgi:hypothetical protein